MPLHLCLFIKPFITGFKAQPNAWLHFNYIFEDPIFKWIHILGFHEFGGTVFNTVHWLIIIVTLPFSPLFLMHTSWLGISLLRNISKDIDFLAFLVCFGWRPNILWQKKIFEQRVLGVHSKWPLEDREDWRCEWVTSNNCYRNCLKFCFSEWHNDTFLKVYASLHSYLV